MRTLDEQKRGLTQVSPPATNLTDWMNGYDVIYVEEEGKLISCTPNDVTHYMCEGHKVFWAKA